MAIYSVLTDILLYIRRLLSMLLDFENKMTTVSPNTLLINIRFDRKNVPLSLKSETTIGSVKAMLASKFNLDPSEIRVIFAGREMHDDMALQDCDLGNHSVLNVVRGRAASISVSSKPPKLLSEAVLKLQLLPEEQCHSSVVDSKNVHFFVYCSSSCKTACQGKLRVRCSTCKQGTLTVSRDPNCWDDVLLPGQISGVCQDSSCDGTTAEFYFKCALHSSANLDSAVPLYQIKNNVKNVPCLACIEVNIVVFVFTCAAAHVICLDCFIAYCISRLNERSFVQNQSLGYTLPCPVGCENSLIKETHHFRLLGDDQYDRYQRFAAEECLLQAGGVLCPHPGCGAGIIPDPDCRRVVCQQQGGQGCGFVFCKDCLLGYHIGECEQLATVLQMCNASYVVDEDHARQAQWEEASQQTIKGYTKPCPMCRTPTEKDGGCMHMVCSRPQCGFHWCWICQTEWTRDCMGNHWFG